MRSFSQVVFVFALLSLGSVLAQTKRDPAAWGSDHVGKPLPEYVTGDECLFCHRMNIGPDWANNRHNLSLRRAEPELPPLKALDKTLASEVGFVLGGKRQARFLKSGSAYGQFDLLSVAWEPNKPVQADKPTWDAKTFGDRCAGCHTTAVDSKTRAFAAPSLDCFACHGEVPLEHSKDTSLVYLSRKRKDKPEVVTSICSQCHLRGGQARSTGLPYPHHFVAGDNLFRDFQVDWSEKHVQKLNPADRHVYESAAALAIAGDAEMSCVNCHSVHKQSSKKHHLLPDGPICLNCHEAGKSKKTRKSYEVHSATCGY